ncbi:cell division cycle-associated protein 4-like [Megalops cyprinoides]|uniref:cell division cycle-associated protein 4-like n=1 Tax=Megalops cyprinoides TaxID=118141 RepID=UPI0018652724|nr:cell division cycle-associated protein 4-like [Megalops cyprinoides]XP_036406506.1 cell division cycle-associated protein 4-like [Megalops cyprinoides]
MFAKGTKRKLSDGGEEAAAAAAEEAAAGARTTASYNLQRQCLLDMSLIKLQLCHMLVEPNLCRSVLIANTVRQIQEEMTRDGSWQAMTEAFSAGQSPPERLVASEVLCRPSPPPREHGDAGPEPFPASGYGGCRPQGAALTAGGEDALCPVAVETGTTDPCWEKGEGPEAIPGDDGVDEAVFGRGAGEGREDEESTGGAKAMEQVYGTFEIKSPAPSPDPALEELFSDVDASYYDLDTMLTGMQGASKMGPYDLLENLSSHGPSSMATNASCRPDLNELDHIMEIIVGS